MYARVCSHATEQMPVLVKNTLPCLRKPLDIKLVTVELVWPIVLFHNGCSAAGEC